MTKAERTKQHIIETAAPIFNKKGIAGTTIDDVLKATKMAKGGLYGHFANKDELLQEVVAHLLSRLKNSSRLVVDSEVTARQKLFAFLDTFSNPVTAFMEGGCPMLNFGAEADDTNEHIKSQVKDAIVGTIKMLETIIRKGVQQKEFVKTLDAETFAVKIFSMLEGNVLIARVLNNNKHMKTTITLLKQEIEANSV